MEEGQPAASLADMPSSIVSLILEQLLGSAGGAGCGGSTGRGGTGGTAQGAGCLKDVVHLAFSCKAMMQAVEVAEQLWQQQCCRLGWSLAWLPVMPPGTTAWQYFCRRMATRHHLRRLLRTLARFLDPASAAAMRPGVSVQALREVEAALQAPLPWELFELFRFCDGQDERGGSTQFFHEARLLSLREALAAAQDRQGPSAVAKAFAALVMPVPAGAARAAAAGAGAGALAAAAAAGQQGRSGGGTCCSGCGGSAESIVLLASGSSRGSGVRSSGEAAAQFTAHPEESDGSRGAITAGLPRHPEASVGSSGSSVGSRGDFPAGPPAEGELLAEPPEVLLPFSAELRGRRRYCMDLQGRVWLASGFFTRAPCLSVLLRRVLT